VPDCGRREAVRRTELAQDVRDVDTGCFGADHEGRGDLAVDVAAGDQAEDLGLPGREAKDVFHTLLSVGRRHRHMGAVGVQCDLVIHVIEKPRRLRTRDTPVGAVVQDEYSVRREDISALAALDARYAWIMITGLCCSASGWSRSGPDLRAR
jgi:hypothetical protein